MMLRVSGSITSAVTLLHVQLLHILTNAQGIEFEFFEAFHFSPGPSAIEEEEKG